MFASSLVLVLSLATVGVGEGVARVESLNGIVVGPEGRPVADADVIATSGGNDGRACNLLGRTRSDDQGRFVIPLKEKPSTCDRPTLWAIDDGMVVGSSPIDHRAIDGQPVKLLLEGAGGAEFVVADPNGRPILGAKIIPRMVARDASSVPNEVAELASSLTDHDGHAELDGFFPEELLSVAVEAPGFGTQIREFRKPDGLADIGTKGITLLPSGQVTGRIVADDLKALSGLTVRVDSASDRGASNSAFAEVRTDSSGHFVVPAIASGVLTIRVRPRNGSPDLPARVIRRTLEPGKSVEVDITLRRGVRVTGSAVGADDGKPIAGVSVAIVPSGSAEPTRVVTDEQGHYETFVPAGLVSHRVLKAPVPYLCPPDFVGPRPVEVPPAIARFELPLIKLQRGGAIRGIVVDSQKNAVSAARVEASWMMVDGRTRARRSESTTSTDDGSFLLHPVPTDCEVTVSASIGESSTKQPTIVRFGDARPVVLTVEEPDGTPAIGLVRSPDGRGIGGASIRIWSIHRTPGGSIESSSLVRFDGSDDLMTDDDGRFQTPGPLRLDREYRAFASAEGYHPSQSRAIKAFEKNLTTFPDLVLEREGRRTTIQGRVIDRSGKPLTAVSVRTSADGPCCRRTTTDELGKFRLTDVPDARLFLFAEREGFRFFGRSIEPSGSDVELSMTRLDEPAPGSMTTRPIPPSGLGLARRVLAPYAAKVLTEGDHATRIRTLKLLARVDPKRVLGLIEAKVVDDAWLADDLRHAASCSPSTEPQAERKAVIEAIQDAEWRAIGHLDAADSLPESSKTRKREWIEQALADARTIRDPSRRVVAFAKVADRLLRIGETDRATQLLDEVRPIAEGLPSSNSGGRARVELAETLAKVDPAGALALTEGLVDPGTFDRCRVAIARTLAARQPTEAGKILESLRDPRSLAPAVPLLCQGLAAVDPAQARRLLDRVRNDEPCLAPYALGLMALAVADRDKPQATAWLREAYDRLSHVAGGSNSTNPRRDPAAVAAALLPVAETIDPTLVPELFWKAVSLHSPRTGSDVRDDALLALLLARYDRSVAQTFFEPLADRALSSSPTDLAPLIAALAILDPFRAVRLVEELPEPADLTFHHLKNEARLNLAAALVRGAPACWEHATTHFLHLATEATPEEE